MGVQVGGGVSQFGSVLKGSLHTHIQTRSGVVTNRTAGRARLPIAEHIASVLGHASGGTGHRQTIRSLVLVVVMYYVSGKTGLAGSRCTRAHLQSVEVWTCLCMVCTTSSSIHT